MHFHAFNVRSDSRVFNAGTFVSKPEWRAGVFVRIDALDDFVGYDV